MLHDTLCGPIHLHDIVIFDNFAGFHVGSVPVPVACCSLHNYLYDDTEKHEMSRLESHIQLFKYWAPNLSYFHIRIVPMGPLDYMQNFNSIREKW